ncbi:MAG TPA: hypothetical protein VGO90_02590 [Chthoniobacteraceae bacterium]|nr:hypothetical protein [Chthoniobacteraceae bacterium]
MKLFAKGFVNSFALDARGIWSRVRGAIPYEYLPESLAEIRDGVSAERLRPYLAATHDLAAAIRLYERNTALSEALYCPLQGVEIATRNALHLTLTGTFGATWFDALGTPTLHHEQLEKLTTARAQLQRRGVPITAGRMVAELSFGFWSAICARRYLVLLWNPCLHRAFPKRRREDVFNRLDSIRTLRNRVAHHEPIWTRDLAADHDKIIEAIRWICPISAEWVANKSRLKEQLAAG